MAENGTVAFVGAKPKCDICIHVEHIPEYDAVDAEYDFKTQSGTWANGCEQHYQEFRLYPSLGTGKGQKLVVRV